MLKLVCDICGKVMESECNESSEGYRFVQTQTYTRVRARSFFGKQREEEAITRFDVCDECFAAFKNMRKNPESGKLKVLVDIDEDYFRTLWICNKKLDNAECQNTAEQAIVNGTVISGGDKVWFDGVYKKGE